MASTVRLALVALAIVLLLSQAAASAPLPGQRVHGQAELAYMAASDIYRYLADVNLWFDFGSWKKATFFFDGGVLVYASQDEDRGFQPDRLRGTLELGSYVPQQKNTYYFYVKHQSFHDIDSFDNSDESYEIYTLAYRRHERPVTLFASAGKFENQHDNDYDWEFLFWFEVPRIGMAGKDPLYLSGSARHVTETDNPTGRDGFTDFTAEFGIQTTPGLRFFTAYRQIHDINRFNGLTDHELLLGMRYGW